MSLSRQERRRALKPKMQEIRQVTQKGGNVIHVAKRTYFERMQAIMSDPEYLDYSEVFRWLESRPRTFGCDPEDPFPGDAP